jgi:hypothetical protein
MNIQSELGITDAFFEKTPDQLFQGKSYKEIMAIANKLSKRYDAIEETEENLNDRKKINQKMIDILLYCYKLESIEYSSF